MTETVIKRNRECRNCIFWKEEGKFSFLNLEFNYIFILKVMLVTI